MTIHSAFRLRVALKSSASFDWVKAGGVGVLLTLPLFASQALANPLSAAVTTGSASIATSANKTQIDQKSEDVVINWSSFNIGVGQTTQFVQPNAQAIAVNRIGGNSASQILGTLDANGRIVLINGNGMLFAKGAVVNVGSLVATSTGGSDSDVLSGKFTQAGNQNAAVVNQGRIATSQGGLVALVAPSVTNAGTVNAKFGTVAVGAANKFTVDFSGDGLVSFAAQGDVNGRASAVNTGLLSGANVSLTAHAAEGLATGVVNMSGIITAQTARNVGGTILLDAGNGSLAMMGTLNAAGTAGGGAIETSGHQVAISGHITAGQGGSWKVDPENLTIDSSAASTIDSALNSGTSVTEQTTSGAASGYGNQTPGAGDIIIASPLAWNTAATLTLDAYHSIDINAPIAVEGGGGLVFKTNDGGTGGDYVFANGAGITYPGGPGLGASFTLNGTPYTLLYSMSDVQNINASSTTLAGDYALANPLDASSVTGWIPIGTDGNGNVTNSGNGFTSVFAGLGNTISNLSISLPSTSYVGLFGSTGSGASIRDIGLIDGNILGDGYVGGLVGFNDGLISGTYSTSAVSATGHSGKNKIAGIYVGGLVGFNQGTITDSYTTGPVSTNLSSNKVTAFVGGLAGYSNGSISNDYVSDFVDTLGITSAVRYVGGLVGLNQGDISDSFAAAIVYSATGRRVSAAGGLAAVNNGTISDSYAIGAVIGTGGGLVGLGDGTVVNSYWDTQTSGQTLSGGGTGLTSAQLMGSLPAGFSSSTWGTGPDLLPYLLSQYPTGTPQSVSGYAYKDDGTTPLGPTSAGTNVVFALLNGVSLGSVTTGADGFYYFLLAPGTISSSGAALLAYTEQNSTTGAANGALLDSATGSIDFLNIWGGQLIAPTNYTTYTLASETSLQSQDAALLAQAEGSNAAAQALVSGLTYYGYLAMGSSFTIDEPLNLSDGLYVQTSAPDAGITVADAMTLSGTGKLRLDAIGNIAINATVSTGGLVALTAGGTATLGASILGTKGVSLKSGGNLVIDKKITSSHGTVTLTSSGTIEETGAGLIDSDALTGSSVGGTTLNGANLIDEIVGFANKGAGGISLTNDQGLSIDGAVSAGTGNLSLSTDALSVTQSIMAGGTITLNASGQLSLQGPITSSGNITLDGTDILIGQSVTSGGTVLLTVTGGSVSESGSGLIDAATLTGSSVGATLNGANQIAHLNFNPGGGDFSLTDNSNLAIAGTLDAGKATLNDTGSITQTTGVIDASNLTGSSAGGANFGGANLIGTLDAFTNTGAGGFSLTDGEALAAIGPVNAGSGNLSLTTTGSGNNITIYHQLTAGGTLALNSSGTLAESSTDILAAAELTGSAAGATTLKGANLIANLGNFADTGGNFSLIDEEALTVSGTVNTGSHTQTIQVTSGDLDLTGALDGKTVTLGSSTGEVYGAGTITANLLNVTANTGIDLTGDNDIGTIGTDQTNSGPNFINNP